MKKDEKRDAKEWKQLKRECRRRQKPKTTQGGLKAGKKRSAAKGGSQAKQNKNE